MLSLFVSQIPEDTVKNSRFSYIEQGEPVSLEKLGKSKSSPESDYQTYIESCIAGLLKVNTFLLMPMKCNLNPTSRYSPFPPFTAARVQDYF